jgi:quercetin dioxygenase-like cupin family protein
VVSAKLNALVKGKERTLSAGEELLVSPGTPHRWWNTTDEEVHIEHVVSPMKAHRNKLSIYGSTHKNLASLP